MAFVLSAAGCTVVGPAPNLSGALKAAQDEWLDAAVLDVNLDGDFVWPAAEALRSRGVPFVFTTGYGGAVQPPPGLMEAPRLSKPVDPGRLVTTLAGLVAS